MADVVKHALDLLVREPDVDGFFGALTKTVVDETESRACGVWLIEDDGQRCDLWMAYVKDRLFTPRVPGWETNAAGEHVDGDYPCQTMAAHLFGYTHGWTETIEYAPDDSRLPEAILAFHTRKGCGPTIATPLVIGGRTLGWLTL